jgi:hypothetical protein
VTKQRTSSNERAVGEHYVGALAARDYTALMDLLSSDVRLRALVPPGMMEDHGPQAVADRYGMFLGDGLLELLASDVSDMSDRTRVTYRFKVRHPSQPVRVFEQIAFCAIEDGKAVAIDLVCSGYRPCSEPVTETG